MYNCSISLLMVWFLVNMKWLKPFSLFYIYVWFYVGISTYSGANFHQLQTQYTGYITHWPLFVSLYHVSWSSLLYLYIHSWSTTSDNGDLRSSSSSWEGFSLVEALSYFVWVGQPWVCGTQGGVVKFYLFWIRCWFFLNKLPLEITISSIGTTKLMETII